MNYLWLGFLFFAVATPFEMSEDNHNGNVSYGTKNMMHYMFSRS